MGMMRNACKILVGKAEGKRPLWRTICSWNDNIKMDFKEIIYDSVDWIHVV
jgi:hypothetical protein